MLLLFNPIMNFLAQIKDDVYKEPRGCLKCGVSITCATDMFLHLKTHL